MEFRVAERWEILDDGIPGTESEFFAKDLSQVSRGCPDYISGVTPSAAALGKLLGWLDPPAGVFKELGSVGGCVWDLMGVLGVAGHLVRVPGPGGHAGSHQRTQQRCWCVQYR